MFRTRDFVLVFTAVAFLVMAIGVTVFGQLRSSSAVGGELKPAISDTDEYVVVTENANEFSRSQKLQDMRDKIAASSQLSIMAPKPVEVVEDVQSTTSTATSSSDIASTGPRLCPGYAAAYINWSPIGIEIEEAEGVRLVFRNTVAAPLQDSTSTSSFVSTQPQRIILASLPVRNFPSASTACISSDVIGIATDGSLIRNNEASVYGIFTSSTLVGWALDGFPIYGSAASTGDACGGVMAAEGYRYQISSQRDTIINCFSAAPIRL